MRTIYGIQFQVKPRTDQSSAECIGELRQLAAAWVAGKYRRAWNVEVMPLFDARRLDPIAGHWVVSDHECHDECELVSLEWGHPDDRDDSIAWVTSCVFARNCDAVHAAISIRLSSARFIVRPTRYALGRPKIVSDVLTAFSCTIGGQEVPTTHTVLRAPDVAGFVDTVLASKDRALPVIVVSPDVWTEKPVVNTTVLQTTLVGFGQVVLLVDKWAAFKLTDKIGRELTCFDGAVRIYWPGFSPTDRPFIHPLYLGRSIKHHRNYGRELKSHLFRMFAGMSAFRAGELGPILTVRRQIESLQENAIVHLREQMKAGTAENEQLLAELERQLQENEKVTKERDDLSFKVEELTEELERQRANWALYEQYTTPQATQYEFTPDDSSKQQVVVTSVQDAVEKAECDFVDTIVFIEGAKNSAKDSPFQSPELVYHLFEALNELCLKWKQEGKLGETWKMALTGRGFEYKPDISETAKGSFKADYTFMYKGKKLLFGEHVTFGVGQDPQKCLSVHWHRDNASKIIAIGHCGKHLANTKA